MITKPTVLVLGAGASIAYGFPSGNQLLETIHQELNPDSGRRLLGAKMIEDCGISPSLIKQFRWQLYYSQQPSVDAFLEHRPEFLEVGKLTIALCLIPHEDQDHLLRFQARVEGCYQYLFANMNGPFDTFQNNQLSVITFNYDRSFEHYLFSALVHSYGKPQDQCAEKIGHIPIIHVHGSLGPLPWQSSVGRPYEATYGPDDLVEAAKQIKIVSEAQFPSPEFTAAHEILKKAQRIYFLGFGYHNVNLERLRLDQLPKPLLKELPSLRSDFHMTGTTLGLGATQRMAITRKWHIELSAIQHDTLRFLRENAFLD